MTEKEKDSWRDISVGVIFSVFGILVLLVSRDLPGATYDPLGPAFMPRALGLICSLTACVILYHGLRKRFTAKKESDVPESAKDSAGFKRHPIMALAGMFLVFLYILALDLGLSGFRTLTVVFILVFGAMLMKREKTGSLIKKGVFLVALALCLSFGLFFLFTRVFSVDLY